MKNKHFFIKKKEKAIDLLREATVMYELIGGNFVAIQTKAKIKYTRH
jgi:hypothetical protein